MKAHVGAGRLVAVVVTYNRLMQLEATLARLLAASREHLEALVVVDNASDDGTAAWLDEHEDPRLDVLTCEENLGGAGGFEQGMRRAMERHEADWLVLMDDDGRPEPDALQTFQSLDLGDWDAVVAAVRYPGGAICEMNCPSRNPFTSLRTFLRTTLRLGARSGFHLGPGDYDRNEAIAVDIASFVGFFVSREAVERVGYPDPSLFVYGDDAIYSLELRERGLEIGFLPQLRFEHDCLSSAMGRMQPMWKVYYYHRNLLMLYRKAAGLAFWPLLLVVVPKWLVRTRHYSGDRATYLRLLRRAVTHGVIRHRNVSHRTVRAWSRGGK